MFIPPKAWRFFILNAVRILSLVALLLVLVSNVLVMVNDIKVVQNAGKHDNNTTTTNSTLVDDDDHMDDCDYYENSTVPNQALGVFWAVLNRILILVQVLVLMLSEVGWPQAFFTRFVPFLGRDYGLAAVGTLEVLLGAQILSHRLDTFAIVAAFFLFSIGCVNLLLALVFGKSAREHRSILRWRNRKEDLLPRNAADLARVAGVPSPLVSAAGSVASSIFTEKTHERQSSVDQKGFGFGRQGEKSAGLKGFLVSKPVESLPRYASGVTPPRSPPSQTTPQLPLSMALPGRSSPTQYPRRF